MKRRLDRPKKAAPKYAAKPAKDAAPKKFSAINAAAKVLAEAKEPMACKELLAAMEKKGLWTSPGGKTPNATMFSAILREINAKGSKPGLRRRIDDSSRSTRSPDSRVAACDAPRSPRAGVSSFGWPFALDWVGVTEAPCRTTELSSDGRLRGGARVRPPSVQRMVRPLPPASASTYTASISFRFDGWLMTDEVSSSESEEQLTGTSTSLLQRAGQGDVEAAKQVFFLYQPLVFRWCRFKGLSENDIEDVSQEVLLAVFRGIGNFQRARTGSFRRWMRQITHHKISDHYRKQGEGAVGGTDFQNRMEDVAADTETVCEEATERQIILRQAAKMLQMEFSTAGWQIFYRSEIEQHDTATICQELQISPGAFRVAKSRVKKRLREVMQGLLS